MARSRDGTCTFNSINPVRINEMAWSSRWHEAARWRDAIEHRLGMHHSAGDAAGCNDPALHATIVIEGECQLSVLLKELVITLTSRTSLVP